MATSSSNEVGLYYDEESAWNETPSSPKLTPVRYVLEDLAADKLVRMSESIRTDRQRLFSLRTGETAAGSVTVEHAAAEYADWIGGALGSTGVTVSATTLADVTITAAAKTIVSAATDFAAAGVVAGMWIRVAGSSAAANNATWLVISCVTTTITVDDPDGTLVNTALDDITVTARMYRNGTTARSFLIEKQFTDISRYEQIHGARVSDWTLTVGAREITRSVFTFAAAHAEIAAATVGDGSPYSYATTTPMTGAADVVSVECGGALTGARTLIPAGARTLSLKVANNPRNLMEWGATEPAGIELGWQDITGQAECYFEEATLAAKLLAHTETILRVTLADSAGTRTVLTFPRIVFMADTPVVPGGNEEIVLPLTFAALRDATVGYTVQVDII